jgi:hypothetical protein
VRIVTDLVSECGRFGVNRDGFGVQPRRIGCLPTTDLGSGGTPNSTDLVSNRDGFGVDYDRFGGWCDRFGVERKYDGFGVDRWYLRRIWDSYRPSATNLGWPPPSIWIPAHRTRPPKCDGLGVATPFRKTSTSCPGEGKMTARYSPSANTEIFSLIVCGNPQVPRRCPRYQGCAAG